MKRPILFFRFLLELVGLRPRKYRILRVNEMVDVAKRFQVYAIGENGPWLATMICPCGCGDLIELSLLELDSPSWKLTLDESNLPTLDPSVCRSKGCCSHFFLRDGEILWF
jgi:hypothetical protein